MEDWKSFILILLSFVCDKRVKQHEIRFYFNSSKQAQTELEIEKLTFSDHSLITYNI